MSQQDSSSSSLGTATSSTLFYVALGIGVLFAAIFAFMGFRYCYRRRRHPELFEQQEIAMQQAHAYRANGRIVRKKKPKLMTQAQVDELFPVMNYKSAKLHAPSLHSATDSVNPPPERQSSESSSANDGQIQNVHTHTHDITPVEVAPAEIDLGTTSFEKGPRVEEQLETRSLHSTTQSAHTSPSYEEEEEDDEPTVDLLRMGSAGDNTCAICIEEMEDQEDVRLLTCGHIFHQDCVDPWLTTRRAYCPLCKHDYYVAPPPGEEAEAAAGENPQGSNTATAPTARPASRRRVLANLFGVGGGTPPRAEPTPPSVAATA